MSLFVLREGFQVITAPADQARVVHVRTGDALAISAEHAQLLARSINGGLDAIDPWLNEVVERYRDLGLLVPATLAPSTLEWVAPTNVAAAPAIVPHAPADAPLGPAIVPLPPGGPLAPAIVPAATPPPAPLEAVNPGDPVPSFRSNLKIDHRPSSSIIQVHNPESGRSFQLYDFEVSLARMLDGRRTHAEVVDSAQRLGLPVTFDSLVQFIRQLDRYGFLAPAEAAPPPGPKDASQWPPREKWDEALRALYQSGLRLHRQGRYDEAATYFETMLAQDPGNAEATQMLAQSKERAASPPTAALTPLPAPTDPSLEKFDELSLDDAPPLIADLPSPRSTPVPIVAFQRKPGETSGLHAAVAPPIPLGEILPPAEAIAPPPPPPRKFPVAAVVLVLGLAVLGGAGWQFYPRTPNPVVVRPPVVVPAVPDPVAVAATVDAGAEPIVVADPPVAVVVDAGAQVAGVDAGAPAVAVAVVDAGPAAVEVPGAGERQWLVTKIGKRGRVQMGEVVATVEGALAWKVAPEQRVKKGDLVAMIGDTRLVAPVSGLVIQKAAAGANATGVVAAILYHEAYLQTVVTGRKPDPRWTCEVVDEASRQRADCAVVSAVPKGAGFFVTATVVPRWVDAAAEPMLRLAPP